jgi:hypothetical protein
MKSSTSFWKSEEENGKEWELISKSGRCAKAQPLLFEL